MDKHIQVKRNKTELLNMVLAIFILLIIYFASSYPRPIIYTLMVIVIFIYYSLYIYSLWIQPTFLVIIDEICEVNLAFFKRKVFKVSEVEFISISKSRWYFKRSFIKLINGEKLFFLLHQIDRVDQNKLETLFIKKD